MRLRVGVLGEARPPLASSAESGGQLSAVASAPGDDACGELLAVHSTLYGGLDDTDAFYAEMIAARRLVLRLRVGHLYGVMTTAGRRPLPRRTSRT